MIEVAPSYLSREIVTSRVINAPRELVFEAVEKDHAIEGGQQTLSNLAPYVTEISRVGAEG